MYHDVIPAAVAAALLSTAPLANATVRHVPADFPTIQEAIAASTDGDRVVVAPGLYAERIDFLGRDITVQGNGDAPSSTTIDGLGGTAVIIGPGGTLQGFRITNGNASFGAGTEVRGAGSRIIRNLYDGNVQGGGGFGAAIGGNGASPHIERNVFRNNSCDSQFLSGVVAFVNDSQPTIVNNVFEHNPCRAINMTLPEGLSVLVVNNTILDNDGGVRVDARVPTSTQIYRNNIIVGNDIGLDIDFGSDPNNPVWDHNLVFGNGLDYEGIADQTGTNGNISAAPLFVDRDAGKYRLRRGSPAIDAGDNALAPPRDFLGILRPFDGDGDGTATVDMGAHENPALP
jgi:serine protease